MTSISNIANPTKVPVGTIIATILTENNLPSGWYLCNGQKVAGSLPIANYLPNINSKVVLPNLCGTTLVGSGLANSGTNYPLYKTGGEEQHLLTDWEMPAHTHQSPTNQGGWPRTNGASVFGSDRGQEENNHPFTTGSAGGSKPHNNMQPYFVVNYIIYCGTI